MLNCVCSNNTRLINFNCLALGQENCAAFSNMEWNSRSEVGHTNGSDDESTTNDFFQQSNLLSVILAAAAIGYTVASCCYCLLLCCFPEEEPQKLKAVQKQK